MKKIAIVIALSLLGLTGCAERVEESRPVYYQLNPYYYGPPPMYPVPGPPWHSCHWGHCW